ncbi:hypothetical protein UFOVP1462_28 [uncultured Caudovirales phage]|uniref:Uncharacterized protein n=1 Tax=uncultured Caudovirales phage TaxID=2100421 RepID=A0A6J7XCG4_9CAUD|nr:hypothetical protein UFOVP1013_28 [uncultured Caudovirales phage]CAB4202902.1 hypothetical protein UFOVP1364_45 [uncultured Caudovirales phage]CAB4214293.1 hypothetical protein UFOVP1462_28 [uncultured Caudovirales phage]CAB5228780.1 hypothetical protein UFOVP1550_37 [uncultured Caudovirales phage]
MSQINKAKLQAMLMSYLRAGVASCVALYMAGITDPKAYATVFLSSFAGPAMKSIDKSAKQYGVK